MLYYRANKQYAEEMNEPLHIHKGAWKIAQEVMDEYKQETGERIEILYSTVHRHYNGGRTTSEFQASRSHLNSQETEQVLELLDHHGCT